MPTLGARRNRGLTEGLEEATSSPQPERPIRSRNAPKRYESSREPTRPRRTAAEAKLARAQREADKQSKECEEEERFVCGYSYDHVGRAVDGESNPDVWVEVERASEKWTSIAAEPKRKKRVRKQAKRKEELETGKAALKGKGGAGMPVALESNGAEEGEAAEEEEPGQDMPGQEEEGGEAGKAAGLSLQTLSSQVLRIAGFGPSEGDADKSLAAEKVPAPGPSTSPRPSRPSSPSPSVGFMDAVEEIAAGVRSPGNEHVPSYHLETTLSHATNEGHNVTLSRQTTRQSRSRVGRGDSAGQSLFRGSDDDDDDEMEGMAGGEAASSLQGRKKRKRSGGMGKGGERGGAGMSSKRPGSDDDLRQDLNIDAYARSTTAKAKEHQRLKEMARLRKNKLQALKKRRGEVVESSSESSASGSSDSDSIVGDSDDFIVDDDQPGPSSRGGPSTKKKNRSKGGHRSSFAPPSLAGIDPMSLVRAIPRRERLQEYLRWVIVYAIELPVSENRMKQLEAARTNLQDKFRMEFNSLTSQANRRQFTWYLKHYPYFERRPMTKVEKEQHRGCSACHKVSQKCDSAYSCWGYFYSLQTLEKISGQFSSEMSTEAEDWKQTSKDKKGKKVFTFYLGESCAKHASIKHKLFHWERRVLTEIVKLPGYKIISEKEADEVEADEVEAVMNAYYTKFSARCTKLEAEANNLRTNKNSLQRDYERWDDDP